MDGGWLPTLLGTLGGLMGAGLLALLGWWLNRRRLRKAIALVLFYDANAARLDWTDSARQAIQAPRHAMLPAYRTLHNVAADLFPRAIILRLTELTWTMDRVLAGQWSMTEEGMSDAWAIAARAERDLAKHAGVSFDVADELARVEKALGGNKP